MPKPAIHNAPTLFSTKSLLKRSLLLGVGLSTLAMSQTAIAQDNTDPEEIIVTGSRQVIQDSIALKRQNTQIVDGLSADEIGDIPALSIGEALETITGVASHRENGGATEVSIRGLGPYLSSTVVNGRVATNGSGDRSVNFSQFPSELINKLAVFKTQDASQIEGGVAGQIQIETLKPLDYGKRRIQGEIKGNINPDQLDIDDSEAGDIGYRGTLSYVDQYEVGGLGDIGISVGLQRSDISQPEAEFRSTSPLGTSRRACLVTQGLDTFLEPFSNGTVTGFSNNPESRRRNDDDCDDVNVEGFDASDTSGSASPTAEELADFRNGTGSRVEGFDTSINPETGVANDFGVPFVFVPSQRGFRQNDTRDERDAIFGSVQWQPTDRLNVNLDAQWSERTQSEIRSDLIFNGNLRNDTSLITDNGDVETTTLDSLVTTPQGGVLRQITSGNWEVGGGDFEREETYTGIGLNVEYDVTDRLSVSADYGFSETERTEQAVEFRLRSSTNPVTEFDQRDLDVPVFTLFDGVFDVNDHANFDENLRIRIDQDTKRENTVNSLRLDAKYDVDGSFFKNIEVGGRWAQQDYLDLPGGIDSVDAFGATSGRLSIEIEDNFDLEINDFEVIADESNNLDLIEQAYVDIIDDVNGECRDTFRESSFFSGLRGDQALITNVASDGSIISASNSFASFDANCVAAETVSGINSVLDTINFVIANSEDSGFLEEDDDGNDVLTLEVDADGNLVTPIGPFTTDIPELSEINIRTVDVEETTLALYAKTDFETTFEGLPINGNIGLRVVRTEVDATGYRPELVIEGVGDGLALNVSENLEAFSVEHNYTRFLPSAIAIVELADDKLLRLGAFRALSRADPADLGLAREFRTGVEEGEVVDSEEELITGVNGTGNPSLDPLMSWNFDAGFEWYPNADSILALGAYYKVFEGGFTNVVEQETYLLNGQPVSFDVSGLQQVSDETSNLFGIEFTGSHRFSYLPGILSGLGAKISYNYVDSSFEFEDSRLGDLFEGQADGSVVQTNQGIISPAGLPGLSDHTLSAQLYHQVGRLDTSIRYKYRTEYLQPFTSDGTRIRYVGDNGVWEARASYKITDNFRASVEAINIFGEPREDFAFVNDDRFQINEFGPRIFFGLRGRF